MVRMASSRGIWRSLHNTSSSKSGSHDPRMAMPRSAGSAPEEPPLAPKPWPGDQPARPADEERYPGHGQPPPERGIVVDGELLREGRQSAFGRKADGPLNVVPNPEHGCHDGDDRHDAGYDAGHGPPSAFQREEHDGRGGK